MIRTLALGAVLAASTAAGALALPSAQAYILATATSPVIDVPTHAQGLAVAALAFVAMLIGFVLAGLWPFVDETASQGAAPGALRKAIAALNHAANDFRAAQYRLQGMISVSAALPAPQATWVVGPRPEIIRGEKGRFRSANPDAKLRRRKGDRVAVAGAE